MKQKFDVELIDVVSVTVGFVEVEKDVLTFDIHARTKEDNCFAIRCHMCKEQFENSGIFYFGRKGNTDE
jgi:hypothetical protein